MSSDIMKNLYYNKDVFDLMKTKMSHHNRSNSPSIEKNDLFPTTHYLDASTAANIASITKVVAEVEKRRAAEKPYQCTRCSKRYVNNAGLTVHMLSHSPDNQHCCTICNATFSSKQAINQHTVIHSNQQPNQCNICFKTFSYKSGLTHHMQEHNEDPIFTCRMCGKVFQQRTNLNSHILSHSYEEKMSILKSQNREISTQRENQSGINITTSTIYGDIRRPAVDEVQPIRFLGHSFPMAPSLDKCSSKDQTYHDLGSHVEINVCKTFPCEECDKHFKQRATLRTHMLTHIGSRPFVCIVCDMRFTQKSGLDQHSLVHTGQRPHECSICFKTFTHKANLTHHLLTHTGEQKFECMLCGRRFTQKANLQTHILTHTGEKPYGCPICHKRFRQKGGLTHHVQFQHGDGNTASRKDGERAVSTSLQQCNTVSSSSRTSCEHVVTTV